ncbi:MAG: ribonucleotide-diphosphate reductase subunit beta [Candidatus Woesearchaeota archaeon]
MIKKHELHEKLLKLNVIKRDGSIVKFDREKIAIAIYKAMTAQKHGVRTDAEKVTDKVITLIQKNYVEKIYEKERNNEIISKEDYPTVEKIQDYVEESLMTEEYYDVARAYILYRNEHAKLRQRDIFKKRIPLKPYEYPELYEYVTSIRHSYWIHTEFNYTSDIQDFKVNVSDVERNAIRNAMLAIAQIEVAVKTFWGDIYKKLPKPEIGAVGFTFAESEVRHMDAYSHLLEILGLNDEFSRVKEIPVISKRITYLEKAIQNSRSDEPKEYAQSILLFSLFIEHVSLFSQFLIIMSFNKYKALFKGVSNAIEATSKEEQIHGLFGIDVINIIKKEHPEWFDEEYEKAIIDLCNLAFETEKEVVDWILEAGELSFLPKKTIIEFIKNRFNNSLVSIGMKKLFEVDAQLVKDTEWFDDEILATKHGDFFVKRSINYSKRIQSLTGDDLF